MDRPRTSRIERNAAVRTAGVAAQHVRLPVGGRKRSELGVERWLGGTDWPAIGAGTADFSDHYGRGMDGSATGRHDS